MENNENKNLSVLDIQEESKSKYHNIKFAIDGVRYDSKTEYDRHIELLQMEKEGKISNLRFHDKNDTIVLQEKPKISYKPDFCYIQNGEHIIEDVKGFQTDVFKLKKKLIMGQIIRGELNARFILTFKVDGVFKITEQYP